MKRWLAAFIFCFTLAQTCWPEGIASGVVIGGVEGISVIGQSSTPSYTGPGDLGIPNIVAFWSCARTYSTTYTGNVCAVVDAATGNTTGTLLVATAGGIISASPSGSACTWVTGNACSPLATTCASACNVVTAYDQSKNNLCGSSAPCDMTEATNSLRPAFTQNAINGRACLTFITGQLLKTVNSINGGTGYAQPVTLYGFGERTGTTGAFANLLWNNGASIGWGNAANNGNLFANSSINVAGTTDSVFHTEIAVFNGASSSMLIDTTPHTGLSPGAAGITGSGAFGLAAAANSLNGVICEAAAYSNGMTTGNQTTLQANTAAFY